MPVVRTDKGTLYTGPFPGPDKDGYEEFTQEQAESLAKQANEKAEALGIKCRYHVTED